MKREIVFFIFFIFFASNLYGQYKIDEGMMKYYVSSSKSLKNTIQAYQDSCFNLFGCSDIEKLFLVQRLDKDSTKIYELHIMTLLTAGDLARFKKLGEIILNVDSIKVFMREDVLKELILSDSISYIGEKKIELKYSSFETCMQNYGASDYLRFVFLSDGKIHIQSYNYYIPINGKKKLEENMHIRNSQDKKER